ncbi:hypothetical protein ACXYMX_08955 [Sporosarcina sp. CAU 1771]
MVLNSSFKTSVNIKFDLGNEDFVRRYLPTPSHAESLIGLAEGFVSKQGNSAHIMIGPYGSGKSLVATIVANFVSKAIKENEINVLVNKFDKVHQEVFQSLLGLRKLKRKYIPITLSGREGVFSDVVITSIIDELRERGISVQLPGERNRVKKIVNEWYKEYPNTYKELSSLLETRNQKPDTWLKIIEGGSSTELNWFKSVYPNLSSGASFPTDNGGSFIEQIEIILDKLKKENIGLFIVYDEFGRFLQTIDHQEVYKAMQDLQDLAEIANRSSKHIQVLLISHKSMSQYMYGFNIEYQSEFQRIEKRFITYFVESDTATYYRIADQYLTNIAEQHSLEEPKINEMIMNLRKFNLFQELNQQEVERLIVEGSYPIHPVVLYLLPRISKVFGQNERTLFTFLESEETGGLKNHVRKSSSYYYADNLFEYFFAKNLDTYQNVDVINSLKTFKIIEMNLKKDEETHDLYHVLKLITLWEISHSNSIYKIDSDLIAFAIGLKKTRVEELLEELNKKKFVRFNRILLQWELMKGSSVVVDELIDEKIAELRITQQKRLSFLSGNLKKRYFLASGYNDKKDMTRFMKVDLMDSKEFLKNDTNEHSLMKEDADGYIYLIILDSKSDLKFVTEKIKDIQCEFLMFAVLTEDFKMIQQQVDREMVISTILTDKKTLSEHAELENELVLLHEELMYEISSFINVFLEFKSNVKWFNQKKSLNLKSIVDLVDKISNIMDKAYGNTPIVMNDSVNRMNVIGIQKASLQKVLDGVLESFDQPNIGIEGQGPDYLIYATVIKNNEINLLELDKLKDENLKEIRKKLLVQIKENPKDSLRQITKILSCPPYGIRKPLIPLFVTILLRDKWDQLMFYRNSMYIPALEAEKIYEMFDEPSEYSYDFHDYSEVLIEMMNKVENHLSSYISEHVLDNTPLIRVSSGLLNWLRKLPRHTQISNKLSDQELELKEIIRKSEINPLASIEHLTKIYGDNFEELKLVISKLEESHSKFIQEVEKYLLSQLSIAGFTEKENYLNEFESSKVLKNRLLASLKETNTIEDFTSKYIGIETNNWSDTTYELFVEQLKNDIENFNERDVTSAEVVELTYNNKYKQIKKMDLSTKSKVIYDNLNRMIKSAGRSVPEEEVNYILFKLIEEHIE